jgi:oxygen-independent coproporphyrinogen-3 oxidase
MVHPQHISPLLIRKYDQPVPRYTSYPTVPFWHQAIDPDKWQRKFLDGFHEQNQVNGINLYIHLPFCESLCTYCGCNKKITTNHNVEIVYIEAIQKEWMLYRKQMPQTPVIRELHIGGGTPTFFSPQHLKKLLQFILESSIVHPQHLFSIEAHPNNTTPEHLAVLQELGFTRISYGVQDNDSDVQRIINRIQPFENVKRATEQARQAGFTSVNFDLIYGLPLQTLESMERTMKQVMSLLPDRIAYYSYAHVPWTSKAQRLFDESHLPSPEEKITLYMEGKELLMQAGYSDVGMDHFALPHDELYKGKRQDRLHRNFMGYTTQNSGLLLGLGVSSISDVGNAYAQNEKTLHEYYAAIDEGRFAIKRGYFLSEEDKTFKNYILNISCKGQATFQDEHLLKLRSDVFHKLNVMAEDGLLQWDEHGLILTEEGHYFIRNVCSCFDLYLHGQPANSNNVFSKAI